jgi:Acyl-CoA carboxylase epsilon subunit
VAESASPLLRVVKGTPTDDELAALTAVVVALSQRRPRRRPTPVGGWADRTQLFRSTPRPGPGSWAASGRRA